MHTGKETELVVKSENNLAFTVLKIAILPTGRVRGGKFLSPRRDFLQGARMSGVGKGVDEEFFG